MRYTALMKNPEIDPETKNKLAKAAAQWAGIKETRMAVACVLQAARAKHLTLQELADAVGCSVMTVKRLLSEAEAHQEAAVEIPGHIKFIDTDGSVSYRLVNFDRSYLRLDNPNYNDFDPRFNQDD